MSDGDAFSRLMDEYGRLEQGDTKQRVAVAEGGQGTPSKEDGDSQAKEVKDVLMQLEEYRCCPLGDLQALLLLRRRCCVDSGYPVHVVT